MTNEEETKDKYIPLAIAIAMDTEPIAKEPINELEVEGPTITPKTRELIINAQKILEQLKEEEYEYRKLKAKSS